MSIIDFAGRTSDEPTSHRDHTIPAWLMATTHHTARIIEQPTSVAAAFWFAGAAAAFVADALGNWSPTNQAFLITAGVLCVATAILHLVIGRQMSMWAMQICAGLSLVLVSVGSAIGPRDGMNISVLYIWVLIYAAIYFAPLEAAAYGVAVGLAYGLVLGFGPHQPAPIADWLGVVGTGVFAGLVVLVLVNLLRLDARQDHLTGLANRRSWDERVEEEMERARRSGAALSIALFDLDGFKALNDTRGHAAGDALLQRAAAAWSGAVREAGDFIARVGGDEFAILAPGSSESGVCALTDRLAAEAPHGLSFSCGVATWTARSPPGTSSIGLMQRCTRSRRSIEGGAVRHRTVRAPGLADCRCTEGPRIARERTEEGKAGPGSHPVDPAPCDRRR